MDNVSKEPVGMRKAVVLLSGGLDSATAAAVARSEGFVLYALTFNYGQRHAAELDAAHRVGAALGVERHVVAKIDLQMFGGSALTSTSLEVPKDRTPAHMSAGIPITYVPARNTIFLSFALAWAEVLGADDVFIGVNALDYSGYPDCRPEFVESFERMANLATRVSTEGGRHFRVHAPLIQLSKAEIIATGLALGVDYASTVTCYDPSAVGVACGRCDSCQLRLRGFQELGISDPAPYRTRVLT